VKGKRHAREEAQKNYRILPTAVEFYFDLKEYSCGVRDDQEEEISFPSYSESEVIAPRSGTKRK
jgi:hypothetical protein